MRVTMTVIIYIVAILIIIIAAVTATSAVTESTIGTALAIMNAVGFPSLIFQH